MRLMHSHLWTGNSASCSSLLCQAWVSLGVYLGCYTGESLSVYTGFLWAYILAATPVRVSVCTRDSLELTDLCVLDTGLPTIPEQPSQDGTAEDRSLNQAATAAAQPGSLLEAHFSMPGKDADGSDGQQRSKESGAAGVMPMQMQEAPQPREAVAASKQTDSAAAAGRLSLKERIRMMKGAGAGRGVTGHIARV